MLHDLTLYPGGHLFGTLYTDDREAARLEWSQQAHELLFEPVTLADGVVLRDLFSLLERDPLLVRILRRDFAAELLAHVQAAPKADELPGKPWPPVEYLAGVWDEDRLAHAMIPLGTGLSTGWVQQARVLVADLMRQLAQRQDLTLERMRHCIKAASLDELAELLAGTESAEQLGADQRFASVRLVAATYLAPYEQRVATERPYDPEELEYLELYRVLDFNTGTQTLESGSLVHFHGVGFELREDTDRHGYTQEKGTRINWGISLTDVRELLPLPLRYNPQVTVCESDLDARAYGHSLHEFQLPRITLGDLLHSVLWELSFHGAPAEQHDLREELIQRKAAVDEAQRSGDWEVAGASDEETDEDAEADLATVRTLDDLLESLDRPGVEAVFETIGELKLSELNRALRQLDDDAEVLPGLTEQLGERACQVVIREAYRDLQARALRKAIRETRR